MAGQDWDVAVPIDHTKISGRPSQTRDLKSSVKEIIQKEHVALGADNLGGQHLKGAARVYLADVTPTTDPESNNLDTSATSDDGRIAIATGGGASTGVTNTLKVYIATSAGISTGWKDIRAAYAGTAVRVEMDNNDPILGRKAGTPATTIDLIKVNANDVPEVLVGAVLSADTDPATGVGIATKKWADEAPKAKMKADNVLDATFGAGSGSSTEANGKITKAGITASLATTEGISFAVAFPGGLTSLSINAVNDSVMRYTIRAASASGFTVTSDASAVYHWQAIGY